MRNEGLATMLVVFAVGACGGPTGPSGTTGSASGTSSSGDAGATAGGSASGGSSRDSPFGALSLVAGQSGGPGALDRSGAAARLSGPWGLAFDGAGNLYVGDNDTIRQVVIATGAVMTLAGSPGLPGSADGTGTTARFWGPGGLALDGAGNLYAADTANSTIRKVVIASGIVTTLAGSPGVEGGTDGTGTTARFNGPMGLALDGAGNLYVADSSSNEIRKIVLATGTVSTLATAPAAGVNAGYFMPTALAFDGAGHLFVAGADNTAILAVDVATGAVTTLAGSPGFEGSVDGTGAAARFTNPSGLAYDGAGNLFVSDNDAIRKVVVATGAVTTLAGSPLDLGSMDGAGAAVRFRGPEGLALDGGGHLYIADTDNSTIRRLVLATGAVTTFLGSPLHDGSTDGTGTAARFGSPEGVASDGAGRVYVADTGNCTIRQVDVATGAVTTLAGAAGAQGSTDGVGSAARFDGPDGLAFDGAGNLLVTDAENSTVRQVDVATGAVTTLAGVPGGTGPAGGGSADGVGPAARFNRPSGLALDGAGNAYVADTYNYTIRRVVVATGAVTTLAGSAGNPGSADGAGDAARFGRPQGVALDGLGNLLVSDMINHTIRKVNVATGAVTTLAGSATAPGSADGTGAAAQFDLPEGLALDGAGHLYVADWGTGTIRRVSVATGDVTTVLGVAGEQGVAAGTLSQARLNSPFGLAWDPVGALFISDVSENVLLEAR